MILDDLMTIIEKRIKLLPSGSYVASVYKEGEDKILQKIGEEAIEVILSAKKKKQEKINRRNRRYVFHDNDSYEYEGNFV